MAACGIAGEGTAPSDDKLSSTTVEPTTTTPPKPVDPVEIKSDLCPVIPPEATAAILKISVNSSEMQTGLDSCVGSDASTIPNPQNLIASSMLMISSDKGVYTSVYTEPQVPQLLEAAEQHNIPKLETLPLRVGDEEGVFLPTVGLAEVPLQNGGQELYLNVNAGLTASTEDLATYITRVEAAIFSPQSGPQ